MSTAGIALAALAELLVALSGSPVTAGGTSGTARDSRTTGAGLAAVVETQQTAYGVRPCDGHQEGSTCVGWDLIRFDVATGERLADVDLSPGTILGDIPLTSVGELAIAPGGRRGFVAFSSPAVIAAVDLASGAINAAWDSVPAPRSPVVSVDGRRLYVLSGAGVWQMVVVDTADGRQKNAFDLPGVTSPTSLAVSPDESVAFMGASEGLVKLNLASRTIEVLPVPVARNMAMTQPAGTCITLGASVRQVR